MRDWLLLALVLAASAALRLRDLSAFRLSPDDGNYLHSARLHVLERSVDPVRWAREDADWITELAHDAGRLEGRTTYQHSYLHQFVVRYAYRLGLSRIDALRVDSALLGVATSLVLFVFYRRAFPERRSVGSWAAALLAVNLMHAFLSRTGWGQIGCTAFFVAYFALGYLLLFRTREDDRRAIRGRALGLAACSLLAFGYQEMIAVHVAIFALIALVLPWLERAPGLERRSTPDSARAPDSSVASSREAALHASALATPDSARRHGSASIRAALRSRRVRAAWISAVPVGALALGLFLASDFARARWFTPKLYEHGYFEARRLALVRWFTLTHVEQQVGLATIALACVGGWALWKRDRSYARYVLAWIAGSFGVFFFVFNDPSLERVYLPVLALVVVLAAEGLFHLVTSAPTAVARRGAIAAGVALVVFSGWRTWVTLFEPPEHPLFIAGPYVGQVRARHSEAPILDRLAKEGAVEIVGVDRVKEPLFFLLDNGYRTRLFDFNEPRDNWPAHLVGVARLMEQDHRTVATGGSYAVAAVDTTGRLALYELAP